MTLWGLKTCDTCRKAIKELEAEGLAVTFHDVRADGLPDDLDAWVKQFGAAALVNRRSTTWKALDDAERVKAETARGAADLIRANPTLAKRPMIESGAQRSVGWGPRERALYL